MKRLGAIALALLFLMPAIAGCLEDEKPDSLSMNDIVISPETMIAGEFQPLVITAKRDLSVFIPKTKILCIQMKSMHQEHLFQIEYYMEWLVYSFYSQKVK